MPEPTPVHSCDNCDGVDPGSCLANPARPTPARLRCNHVHLRHEHAPHSWEPQPGMTPVHCEGYGTPPPDGVRDQIARAIHRYDYEAGLSGNDIPSRHHRGEADAVLRVPAVAAALGAAAALREVTPGYCGHCGRGDCSPTADQWLTERRRAERLFEAIDALAKAWSRETASEPTQLAGRHLRSVLAAFDPQEERRV
ncbi:hypothetical protein [Streptomyces sp. NPDC059165]|uniref:hypothetical protein n=1 Tax=Streptomyces sp. NPDC059165 TaxID=3346751 RepID=UPI0036B66104